MLAGIHNRGAHLGARGSKKMRGFRPTLALAVAVAFLATMASSCTSQASSRQTLARAKRLAKAQGHPRLYMGQSVIAQMFIAAQAPLLPPCDAPAPAPAGAASVIPTGVVGGVPNAPGPSQPGGIRGPPSPKALGPQAAATTPPPAPIKGAAAKGPGGAMALGLACVWALVALLA